MSLENLLAIQRLVRHEAGRAAILKLLVAAERNLADAGVTAISAENRFDAAYKAILQCAMAALSAKGYRTSTSQPGHHQTAIQTLPLTLGVDSATVIVLDALRKQRNLSDYTGDGVNDALLAECIAQAESLLRHARVTLGDPLNVAD
ncbi:MAG: DNA-binding protein [Candidatus Accumulibacter sp.]|uniref:DNA-binding protein n=1 Tax=Accumulibacter sp. TaxID=2053492 RepID=UPI0025888AC2|nr:DNA-binding protein [Accumulibacter sp.]MBK8115441.1 DNA-binding protein [Accumulibacter sp.]